MKLMEVSMGANIKELSEENFSSNIGKGITVVDFFATWCGPCRMLAPILEEISTYFGDKVIVGKVDIDKEGAIAQQYQVSSVPTVIMFKDGKEKARLIGLRDFDSMKKWIEAELS